MKAPTDPIHTRYIAVDDTSPDITYDGDWFNETNQYIGGIYGSPYLSTLHGTNSSGSFSFNFSGPAVSVIGSNQIRNDSGATITNLQWSCFVDGVSINSLVPEPSQYPGNNWEFCSADSLADGPHLITVNVAVTNKQTFWFDWIGYPPSASVPLENKSVQVNGKDRELQYEPGWQSHFTTYRNNSGLALNFSGVSLAWYGSVEVGNSTTGLWTIDDSPAKNFTVPGATQRNASTQNQKFFETDQYSMGLHQFKVVYYGNGDYTSAPLILDYLIIQNGTVPGSTNSTSNPSSAALPTHTSIIGGAIGGTIGLLIFVLLFIYRRRCDAQVKILENNAPLPCVAPKLSRKLVSPSRSCQIHGKRLAISSSDSHVAPSSSNSNGQPHFSSSGQDSPLVATVLHRPSKQEEFLPHRRTQIGRGNADGQGVPSNEQNHQHSRNRSATRISSFGGRVVGPPGFTVSQDGERRFTGQDLPEDMVVSDLPPAYTPG